MPDRSEWLRSVQAEAAQPPARQPLIHPAFAQHIRAVAAKMEHLQDSSDWGVYRAQIETAIEEVEQQQAVLRAQMDDLFGDDHLRARLQMADLRGQVKGLRIALQAPGVVLGTDEKVNADPA